MNIQSKPIGVKLTNEYSKSAYQIKCTICKFGCILSNYIDHECGRKKLRKETETIFGLSYQMGNAA